MLSAQNELLSELDGATIRSEALQVVGGWAGDALQDLNRVARDAAPAAVMERAAEARLVLIVRVYVHVLVLL